jgi:hypothetical protein
MSHSFSRSNARRRQAERDAQLARDVAQPMPAHIESLNGTLSLAADATLVAILKSGMDGRMFLAYQLMNRGLNLDGKWVGFAEAERLFVAAFPQATDPDSRLLV